MQCEHLTVSGERCKRTAGDGSGLCYAHDPARATERAESAARGGRGKARKSGALEEVEQIQREFKEVAEKVRSGELGSRPAQVCVAALNGRLRSAEAHHKLGEHLDLQKRIEVLEEQGR